MYYSTGGVEMNSDWYLDPPEDPPVPACPECGEEDAGEEIPSGDSGLVVYQCVECGCVWNYIPEDQEGLIDGPDEELTDEDLDEITAAIAEGSADEMDEHALFLGDLAYDAWREGRYKR
jgi:hypothetical protein